MRDGGYYETYELYPAVLQAQQEQDFQDIHDQS
jgi:hypothetical protein